MLRELTIEEICRKLKPVFGKKIDAIYLKYAMAETREEKEEIAHILNALYHKNLSELLNKKVLLEPPLKEVMDGEYPLATISYADRELFPFSLREQDWIRHICISGMSGSGKTTLAFHIINNFLKKNKPFLIFDWKKSFRPLLLIDSEIMNFTVGNDNVSNLFKMNINQPPEGVSPKQWINVLCDLLTESFFVSFGVHKVLLETLDEAFKEWGIYNGSKNYPTWNHIKWRLEEKLNKTRGRESTWLESALRIASVLTFGSFGKIVNYKGENSMSVKDLLNKEVIFELNALGNVEKKFFCEFILTYIYKFKKAKQAGINENFEYAILVDEAHNIFLKDKTRFVKESVTDMVYREMREYGISLICLDQHISKLSDTVAGNSACHIAFQQQLPQDVMCVSRLMQLDDRKQFFSMLQVGSAIVKLSERYTSPFLIKVAPVSLRKEVVTDKDVADRMKFVFQVREVEQGNDEEFRKNLIPAKDYKENKSELLSLSPKIQNKEQGFWDKEKLNNEEIGELANFKNLKINFDGINEEDEADTQNLVQDTQNQPNVLIRDIEGKQKITESPLNPVQQILYEFVQEKLNAGWRISEIEKFMEERKEQGNYTLEDVSKVINYVLKTNFSNLRKDDNISNEISILENQNNHKEENSLKNNLTYEQKRFLVFLQNNGNHDYSTVELYKKAGLSVRKGNKIKNELLSENLIKIQEQKNKKGWKKIIRIA